MIPPGMNDQLGGGGQPHRRTRNVRIFYDDQGNMVVQPLTGQVHSISEPDCLDTTELDFDAFLNGCGCNIKANPPAQHCRFDNCDRVVCAKHANCCHVCNVPLCLPHLHFLELPDQSRLPVCPTHYDEARRKRFWNKVATTALSPFVKFNPRETAP